MDFRIKSFRDKKNEKILSIIIPAYNAGTFIKRTIDSILVDKCDEIEIIIVNDGSTDNTEGVILGMLDNNYPIKLMSQENKGVSAARNAGMKAALGEYIYFMDADDTVQVNFIDKISPILFNKTVDLLAFGFSIYKEDKSVLVRKLRYTSKNSLLSDYLIGRIRLLICSIIFKRSIIVENGLEFDEDTYYSEDIEFMISVMLKVKNIEILEDSLYNYLMFSDNSAMNARKYTKKRFTTIFAMERICENILLNTKSNKMYKSSINNMITSYILHMKMYQFGSDKEIDDFFIKYRYLKEKIPPFQISKFWIYNFVHYIKHVIFKRNKF